MLSTARVLNYIQYVRCFGCWFRLLLQSIFWHPYIYIYVCVFFYFKNTTGIVIEPTFKLEIKT